MLGTKACLDCQFFLRLGKINICILGQCEIPKDNIITAYKNSINCDGWRKSDDHLYVNYAVERDKQKNDQSLSDKE